jgi:S1/P1 nuclease
MTKRIPTVLVAILLLCVFVAPAYAWNDFGHMTVAYLAYQKLTPAARDRVKALLRLNPNHDKWVAAVPAGMDQDLVVFMLAATWADEIKGDPGYTPDGSAGGNRPEGSPDPNRNTGFDDKLMHKYRHFIDQPFSTDGTPTSGFQIPFPNAKDSIALFRGVIASSDPDDKKAYDLSWLLHLVGDVHQPLHGCTRLTSALLEGDDGGNKVKLHCTGCPSNLHSFWDDVLGTTTRLTTPPEEKGLPDAASIRAVVAFGKTVRKPKAADAQKTSEADWIQESFEAAQQKAYPSLAAGANGSFSVTAGYTKSAKALAKKRVALAGVRLANLINTELK